MQKKGSKSGHRAWHTLRLALLWARKGGILRNKFALSLSLLQKGVRSPRHPNGGGALIYGERELSFDQTPIIHVKMHRPSSLRFKMPHIPCINPHVDFDYDFELNDDQDRIYYNDVPRKSFLKGVEDYNDDQEDDDDHGLDQFFLKVDRSLDHQQSKLK
ncbi:unnamed protein product [Fraxinus pennsylvanica]|uniref:Uncharacterized protein n=1 Tax=Fraxinus pennsylvanica TaxID=56036 RepID=A0AAD2DNU9_9LAMI|nr:unnamed protein product [Fraxinus pennsylvanica]